MSLFEGPAQRPPLLHFCVHLWRYISVIIIIFYIFIDVNFCILRLLHCSFPNDLQWLLFKTKCLDLIIVNFQAPVELLMTGSDAELFMSQT